MTSAMKLKKFQLLTSFALVKAPSGDPAEVLGISSTVSDVEVTCAGADRDEDRNENDSYQCAFLESAVTVYLQSAHHIECNLRYPAAYNIQCKMPFYILCT
jgi:hypothetical protein